MKPALADRLSRAMVSCYPRRWKQRYAAELLDVLDRRDTPMDPALTRPCRADRL
jgi:hypothetical protein